MLPNDHFCPNVHFAINKFEGLSARNVSLQMSDTLSACLPIRYCFQGYIQTGTNNCHFIVRLKRYDFAKIAEVTICKTK